MKRLISDGTFEFLFSTYAVSGSCSPKACSRLFLTRLEAIAAQETGSRRQPSAAARSRRPPAPAGAAARPSPHLPSYSDFPGRREGRTGPASTPHPRPGRCPQGEARPSPYGHTPHGHTDTHPHHHPQGHPGAEAALPGGEPSGPGRAGRSSRTRSGPGRREEGASGSGGREHARAQPNHGAGRGGGCAGARAQPNQGAGHQAPGWVRSRAGGRCSPPHSPEARPRPRGRGRSRPLRLFLSLRHLPLLTSATRRGARSARRRRARPLGRKPIGCRSYTSAVQFWR